MENVSVGVIDSGVGGLSIYAAIKKLAPSLPLTYLADSAHIPYGTKSPGFITTRSKQLVSFLAKQGITTMVIACNTITVTCLDLLRKQFPEITFIGTVPVIKPAARVSAKKAIGVLSTIRTTESAYIDTLIAKFAQDCFVTSLGTDELVPLVEKGELEGEKVGRIVGRVVAPFILSGCDTVVLGCTHFPFLKAEIQKILGKHVAILDSGEAVARQLMRALGEEGTLPEGSNADRFLTTGEADDFRHVISKLLHKPIEEDVVRHVDIV